MLNVKMWPTTADAELKAEFVEICTILMVENEKERNYLTIESQKLKVTTQSITRLHRCWINIYVLSLIRNG
jgi:hypothetical protein